jgi:Palmitoyl protein thioesterase
MLFLFLFLSLFFTSLQAKYPIAVFHGFGDSCSFPGMSSLIDYFASKTQNYVKCIEIGNGSLDSITMKFATQGEKACEAIAADENFKGEIAVVGEKKKIYK